MTKKLPLFYFPPTVCWIDDSQLFLDAASSLFNTDYKCLTFNNPMKGLHFLTSCSSLFTEVNFTREFTESDIFDVNNHLPIDINISEITQLAQNPSNNEEVAVLVIDNNMPNMNGLEICHQLKNHPCKKILLTGGTDLANGIDAFNQGIIDKFIAKENLGVADKLKDSIHELTYQYFYDKTKNLLSHLETSRQTPLSDPLFVEFFSQWRNENQLQEFYLMNRHGSFLLKNNNNEFVSFIVMSESAKNEFLKLNNDIPIQAEPLLSKVSQGKLIPFFGIAKESWEFDYNTWDNYFFPANVLEGREKYYWTVITNN